MGKEKKKKASIQVTGGFDGEAYSLTIVPMNGDMFFKITTFNKEDLVEIKSIVDLLLEGERFMEMKK